MGLTKVTENFKTISLTQFLRRHRHEDKKVTIIVK